MLEYYVREKKSKCLGLSKVFETAPKDLNGKITFAGFKSICFSLNSNIEESFVAKLYRYAWAYSNGKIDCKIFLLVAHELHFFFYCLSSRTLLKPNFLLSKQENEVYNKNLAWNNFLKLKNSLSMIREIAKNLGICEILNNLTRLEGYMQQKTQGPESYKEYDFFDVFRHMWLIVLQIQIIYEEANKNYLSKPINMNDLPKATETFINSIQKILLKRVTAKCAIRKIQKFLKIKAKKSLEFTKTVKSLVLLKQKIKK